MIFIEKKETNSKDNLSIPDQENTLTERRKAGQDHREVGRKQTEAFI